MCARMSMTYTTSYGRANDCYAGRCRNLSVSRRDWSVLIAGRAMEYAEPMSHPQREDWTVPMANPKPLKNIINLIEYGYQSPTKHNRTNVLTEQQMKVYKECSCQNGFILQRVHIERGWETGKDCPSGALDKDGKPVKERIEAYDADNEYGDTFARKCGQCDVRVKSMTYEFIDALEDQARQGHWQDR